MIATAGPLDLVSSAHRMGHERWLAQRLFEILGDALVAVPEPDAKRMVATHCSVFAWHAQLWHDRIPSIPGVTPDAVTQPPSDAVTAFVDALAAPGDTIHRLVGVYGVALPHQLEAHSAWREAVDPLTDAPTARVLDLIVRDERDACHAGEALLISVTPTRATDDAARRRNELDGLLLSARAASPAGAAARGTARRS